MTAHSSCVLFVGKACWGLRLSAVPRPLIVHLESVAVRLLRRSWALDARAGSCKAEESTEDRLSIGASNASLRVEEAFNGGRYSKVVCQQGIIHVLENVGVDRCWRLVGGDY